MAGTGSRDIHHIRPWRRIDRRQSRQISVGSVPVGGGAPISVQSMTNTSTADAGATIDQRGASRPEGAGCDIGAVEGSEVPGAPVSLVVDDAGDAVDDIPGDGACATVSGTCTLRAAVDEANARLGSDVITIELGVAPVLSRAGAVRVCRNR